MRFTLVLHTFFGLVQDTPPILKFRSVYPASGLVPPRIYGGGVVHKDNLILLGA